MTTTTDPRAAAEEALALAATPLYTLRTCERVAGRAVLLLPILARAVIEAAEERERYERATQERLDREDARVSALEDERDAARAELASLRARTEAETRALSAARGMLPWIGQCGGRDMAPADVLAMNVAREHMRHAFALLPASSGAIPPEVRSTTEGE